LGSRLENEAQASGLGLLLSLILAPLGGAWWPLEIVPDFMRLVGHLSPVAWAMDGFNALIFDQAGLGEVLIPLGILLALTLICFAIAIRLFRYE
jgi:ABC-2 type transport system permease protein